MPSARRITFSGEHLSLVEIVQYYSDIEASVKNYFSFSNSYLGDRFVGYTPLEMEHEMYSVLAEHALSTSMSILASLEAAFRMDFLQRCYKRQKDPLSRSFRTLYQNKRLSVWTFCSVAIKDKKTLYQGPLEHYIRIRVNMCR